MSRHRAERKPEHRGAHWPIEDLRRLSQGRSATHRTIITVIDALATQPGKVFSVGELEANSGISRGKIIGAFAGLTRLLRAHYDYPSYGLPFAKIIGHAEGLPKEIYYTVDEEQARRWRQARQ